MSRIKINDLPQNANISQDEMKHIKGGAVLSSLSTGTSLSNISICNSESLLNNPLILSGIVAAAIAVPLAINDNDDK